MHDKRQTLDRNDLKLGMIVILDTVSKKPFDFRFKRLGLWLGLQLGFWR